jgi:hypothetical protein
MTPTHHDPTSPTGAHSYNAIDWLVQASRRYKNPEDFIAFLVSQLRNSAYPPHELKFTIGALRAALAVHLKEWNGATPGSRCNFCGKSPDDVRTMMVSDDSTICDECAVSALHTISHTRGQFYLRIAFAIFRVVASFGRMFSRASG